MGTWSTAISGNDQYQEVYYAFKEIYSDYDGKKWLYEIPEIKTKLLEQFSFELNNEDIVAEVWFALAKAFWDYGIGDDFAFKKTKQIVESGSNLKTWARLEANAKDISKRKKALDEFLTKISQKNLKPVKRQKIRRYMPPFFVGDIITFCGPDGNYYGAVITSAFHDTDGKNIIVLLNYCNIKKPSASDLTGLEIMIMNNYLEQYPSNMSGNPNQNDIWGFLLTLKGLEKAKTVFEKVGNVEFHDFAYFKESLNSFKDMTKYSWDILPEFATANYHKNSGKREYPVLLNYFTTDLGVTEKLVTQIKNAFRSNKSLTVCNQNFILEDIFLRQYFVTGNNTYYLNFAIKNFKKMNYFLVQNILMHGFGKWIAKLGMEMSVYWSRVEDVKDAGEDFDKDYKNIYEAIKEIEDNSKRITRK